MTRDPTVEAANAAFWNELCGTSLAISIGATGRTPDDLGCFDRAFLDFYPYLDEYLPAAGLTGAKVLEIGLGYGTLGTLLVERAASYTGVDISPGPVAMMKYRIDLAERADTCTALEASALALPFEEGHFDFVYSIGCLHHTGDLARAVSEVRRVLRPGGGAVTMLYNRWSSRRIRAAPRQAVARFRAPQQAAIQERARYDSDQEGNVPPHTDFISVRDVRRLFRDFTSVRVDKRNIDNVARWPGGRSWLLSIGADRFLGLDLYVRAVR